MRSLPRATSHVTGPGGHMPRPPGLILSLVLFLSLALTVGACAGVRSADDDPSPTAGTPGGSVGARVVPPDKVRLVVSTDFGGEIMHEVLVDRTSGDSVMKVLAGQADVETAYGGGFVDAIDGLKSTFGGADEPSDWFYWVDGVMAQVGAADYVLKGAETVWWDYHRWQGSSFIPVVLQAFPAPWCEEALTLVADTDADAIASWAATQGLEITGRSSLTTTPEGSAVVAAAVSEVTRGSWLAELVERGPEAGVFVSIDGKTLSGLDHLGDARADLVAAAVAAPHPDDPEAHLLVLLSVDRGAMDDLLDALTTLSGDYVGLGLRDGAVVRLPDEAAGGK